MCTKLFIFNQNFFAQANLFRKSDNDNIMIF